jgi:hypothetical protein
MSRSRQINHWRPSGPSRPGRLSHVRHRIRSASYRGSVAKHFTDETAEFAMPRIGRHAAPETGELDVTQRFDPGFRQQRPVPSAQQQRRDDDVR